MKKIIAAVLLVNLAGAAKASGLEGLRAGGFAPVTLGEIAKNGINLPEPRFTAVNKGISVVINNTSVNNGASSVNTNVNINSSGHNSPGHSAANVAVNNTSSGNGASSVNTNVNVNNTGFNSPGDDNVNVGVNNNTSHNGISNVNTNIDVQNSNNYSPGASNIGIAVNNSNNGNAASHSNTNINASNTADNEFSDDNISVNVGNNDTNNGVSDSNSDVTVNGVNANAGYEGDYKSPVTYRYRSQAQKALDMALDNMKNMRKVQILSWKLKEQRGYGFSFEIKFRSTLVLRTYAPEELYSCPELAGGVMERRIMDLQSRNKLIVSAEMSRSGNNYSYVIAYFSAR